MSETDCTLHAAARGWDFGPWLGRFYPEDLPPEWRLSYYSNEFSAVVVPPTLSETQAQCVLGALEEGGATRFYLELPWRAGRGAPALGGRLATQRMGFAGAMVPCEALPPPGAVAHLEAGGVPVCLELPGPPDEPLRHIALGRGFSLCWTEGEALHCDGDWAVSRWSGGADLRGLRGALERVLATNAKRGLLVVDGSPPDLEALRTATTLIGLLGY